MSLLQPWMTKLIIDDGLLASDFDALLQYSGILLLIGAGSIFLSGYNRLRHTRISGEILFALREDVYSHLQKLPPAFFAGERTGDLISRIDRDVAEIQRFAVDTLFSSFSAVVGLVGTLAMMITLSPELSLILLVLVPLELIYLKFMRPRVERQNRQVRERSADISSFLAEKIPAIKFVQSSNAEGRELDRLHGLNRFFLKDLFSLQLTEFWTGAVPSLMLIVSRAGVFLLGGYWVIQGEFQLGSLIAFGAYLGMATGPVQSLLGLYLAWQRLRVSLERVSYIREQELPKTVAGNPVPDNLEGTVKFNAVRFSHREDIPILQDASFDIPIGSRVGILGQTGAGKSTLLDLLQSYLSADGGTIEVGGIDISTFNAADWRSRIAVVPQEPVIFRDTLLSNLTYIVPYAGISAIKEAIVHAQLSDLVERLPDGLETIISERGANLSGGEKQRIAIARTMLQKPVLVLMDEPTSAVDMETEAALIRQVDQLFEGITRIYVSHRAALLADVDVRLSLDNGVLTVAGH